MKVSRRLIDALDAVGARLKREKKHLVYELPNGRTFVVSKTPSDARTADNAISDLRAVAGVGLEQRSKASAEVRAERRRRPGRNGADVVRWGSSESTLATALRDTGIVEQQLRAENDDLRRGIQDLAAAIEKQAEAIRDRDAQIAELESLWAVRAVTFLRRLCGRLLDRQETIADAYSTSERGLW